jgi:hypothetical protein
MLKGDVAGMHAFRTCCLSFVQLRTHLESFEAFGRVGPTQGVAVRATLQGLNKGHDGILHLTENCSCF